MKSKLCVFGLLLLLVSCAPQGRHAITLDQLPTVGFEQAEVIELGRVVQVAYRLFDEDPGVSNPAFPQPFRRGYSPLFNLLAQDRSRGAEELYGHLSWRQAEPGTLVVSIRGTSDPEEWLDDFEFSKVPFSDNRADGRVEYGFHAVYSTFAVAVPGTQQRIPLAMQLREIPGIKRLVVVGHSLGSSLATLVAFDAARNEIAPRVDLLAFASPATGDQKFVSAFEARIKNSVVVINHPDLVPRTPPEAFGFRQVWHQLNVDSYDIPLVKKSLSCYHSLATYLYLLDEDICLLEKCTTAPVRQGCIEPAN